MLRKLVASKANQLLIVVDETKLVQNKINLCFTCRGSSKCLETNSGSDFEMNGSSNLRMATKKAGPVVTDQGNLI